MGAGVERRMEGKGKFGIDMYTLLYLKRINKKDLLYSTGNSAQCYGSLDGRGVWGSMDACICVGSLDGRGVWGSMDACICVAETLPRTRNYHNIVNWLYPNTK